MPPDKREIYLDTIYHFLRVAAFAKQMGGHYHCTLARASYLLDYLLADPAEQLPKPRKSVRDYFL